MNLRTALKIAAVLLVSCDPPPEMMAPIDAGSMTEVPDAGEMQPEELDARTLYLVNCGGCHGIDGEGSSAGPQILNPVNGYATYVVRTGRNEMGFPAGMAAISETQVNPAQLTKILGWLGEAKHPTDGATLYRRFCANCHGADAAGGRVKKGIAGEDELEEIDEAVREGHHLGRYAETKKFMPAWQQSELTNVEVLEIANWLKAQPKVDDDDDDDDDK